jgi:hypothetical protein
MDHYTFLLLLLIIFMCYVNTTRRECFGSGPEIFDPANDIFNYDNKLEPVYRSNTLPTIYDRA